MSSTSLKINSHTIRITHPEKVLFPDDGITKDELIDYFRRIAGIMVPHLKGRPTVLLRVHDDIREEGYYQQAIPNHAPDWVSRLSVTKEGGAVTHILCNNAADLVYLANLDCITLHTWLSQADKLDYPDQVIFDLDPPNDDFELVRQGARRLKKILDTLELTCFVKTTGSHGLHVVLPLKREHDFEAVRRFAQVIATIMTDREPQKYTTEQRRGKRNGRLFIDTLRNAYGHTAVAPYAVRAHPGAPIAAPIFWEELELPDLTARKYNLRNIFSRLGKTGDPWKDIKRQAQALPDRSQIEKVLEK